MISRFVDGTNNVYRTKWAEEQNKPETMREAVLRFAQYERGRITGRAVGATSSRDPDAIELTAAEVRPARKHEDMKCFNCGKKGHLARNCRKPKTEETLRKQKEAAERSKAKN